jgi:hypothetical protein
MASKRRFRRQSCEKKIKHKDEQEASGVAWYLQRTTGVQYHAYRCGFCGGWHAGRPGRRIH